MKDIYDTSSFFTRVSALKLLHCDVLRRTSLCDQRSMSTSCEKDAACKSCSKSHYDLETRSFLLLLLLQLTPKNVCVCKSSVSTSREYTGPENRDTEKKERKKERQNQPTNLSVCLFLSVSVYMIFHEASRLRW